MMEARPTRLSVVLPTYNHAQYLPRALDALLAQDFAPIEIIVVNDASTDETAGIVSRYQARSTIIRSIVHERNLGVIGALNSGLAQATGELIYFGAADDYVLPEFFARAVRMLTAYPMTGLFCGDAVLVDGESGRLYGLRPAARPLYHAGVLSAEETRQLLARIDNWVVTSSAVFRRDAIEQAGGLNAELGSFADGYMARKIMLQRGFCYSPEICARWSVFRTSLSRERALQPTTAAESLAMLPSHMEADPVFPRWYAEKFRKRWRFATARLALDASPIDRELLLRMGATCRFDRNVLGMLASLPMRPLARLLILAWLWFRLRPYALTSLLATQISRSLHSFRDSR
jgi:glycosyltransferase involved in cell wall biosynthesis